MPTLPASLANPTNHEFSFDLRNSLNMIPRVDAIPGGAGGLIADPNVATTTGACSMLRRAVRQEETFKNIYEWLIVIASTVTVALLVVTIVVLPLGIGNANLVTSLLGVASAAGTIVTGTALGFVIKMRAGARTRYQNAVTMYLEHGC